MLLVAYVEVVDLLFHQVELYQKLHHPRALVGRSKTKLFSSSTHGILTAKR